MNSLKLFLFIGFTIICLSGFSQTEKSDSLRNGAPKVFMDCSFCDEADLLYVKQQLPYLNYVRDRKVAQIQVLFTEQANGSGGSEVTLTYIGLKEFEGLDDTLVFSISPNNTEQEIRDIALNYFTMGLIRYIARTPIARKISIEYTGEANPLAVEDKWKNWVFGINMSSWFSGEQLIKSTNFFSSLSARKITPKTKFEFSASNNFNQSKYTIDDEVIIGLRKSQNINALLVKSINEHWSAGGTAQFRASLYENISSSYRIAPAIEYNIFPYSQSTRRQLRILYSAGYRHNIYTDTTIFNKIKEGLQFESLSASLQLRENWGSVTTAITGSHYFHDFNLNRLEVWSELSLRLFKGLSFNIMGSISLIHDQISLLKSEVSAEDILLQQKQLSTQFSYWGNVGISYTFGSIYSSVVNPRFGSNEYDY